MGGYFHSTFSFQIVHRKCVILLLFQKSFEVKSRWQEREENFDTASDEPWRISRTAWLISRLLRGMHWAEAKAGGVASPWTSAGPTTGRKAVACGSRTPSAGGAWPSVDPGSSVISSETRLTNKIDD